MSLLEFVRDKARSDRYKIVIHADKRPANEHVRRYSEPSCSEVAALIRGNKDEMVGKRDIFVRKRDQANSNGNELLGRVSISHRSFDPLSYVVLFPNGTDGWHRELRFDATKRRRKLTPSMFSRRRMFQRRDEFNTVLSGSRLFQHYSVDPFCKREAERVSYLLQIQQSVRAENYAALRELLGDSGIPNDESDAVRSGRLAVLPSTYIGGELYIPQKMHDIIAIRIRWAIRTYS